MELAIPLVALGSLYLVSNQNNKSCPPNREKMTSMNERLPNSDVPNVNYPVEYPIIDFENQQTSNLSVVNKYDEGTAYTDKYFNMNQSGGSNGGGVLNAAGGSNGFVGVNVNGELIVNGAPVNRPSGETDNIFAAGGKRGSGASAPDSKYYSLTGDTVDSSYFQHNNMVPFFGSHIRSRLNDENKNEGLLDNMMGSGSQQFNKTERAPLFAPMDNVQYAHGAPINTDFIQSRMNTSMKMSNVKPFAEERVLPGLGGESGGGFNSGMMAREQWMPRNVDQLRTENIPKSGGVGLLGHEGPAISSITQPGIMGKMEKNRVDRTFDMGPERYMTTTGVIKGQTMQPITIERNVNRTSTTTSYTGAVSATQPGTYVDGSFMPSKHKDLGALPVNPADGVGRAGAYSGDYGIQSIQSYQNNRSTSNYDGDGYFGAIGGAFGAAIAPLLDVLRPSRKTNVIGTLRPYQNPKAEVANSYLFDPSNRLPATIRDTTSESLPHYNVNANQRGGAYEATGHQVSYTNRNVQGAYDYQGAAGVANAKASRTYDAEYKQRNNDIKSSTIDGRLVKGNMSLLNGDINQRQKLQMDRDLVNQYMPIPALPDQGPNIHSMGRVAGQGSKLYSGIQLDRNSPEMLDALQSNPYTLSVESAFR